jgi:hypothetical protein
MVLCPLLVRELHGCDVYCCGFVWTLFWKYMEGHTSITESTQNSYILYSFNTSRKSDSVNNESESCELYGV